MKINVFYNVKIPPAQRKTSLFKAAVSAALGRGAKRGGEINLVFVSGAEIHKINKQFLNHDYETDVISFGYPSEPETLSGDIFVCVKTAQKNALLYKQSVLEELLTYAVHGALHLAGMDDAAKKERALMDKAAMKIISKILNAKTKTAQIPPPAKRK
ncbi:MAG: rRNA maturation RNase YbeY [Elusimicrobium sp.]|jgi:probable rRNA maturation factor|nr:rRNA maturation RNase YbeY [Elusimicrobium sp.]